MTCCIHAIEERHRADRIERQATADFLKAVEAVDRLQRRVAELEAEVARLTVQAAASHSQ